MSEREVLTPEDLAAVRPAGPGAWLTGGEEIAFFWADRDGTTRLWRVGGAGRPSLVSSLAVALEETDGTDRRDVLGGPQWDRAGRRCAVTAKASAADGTSIWIVDGGDGAAVELAARDGDHYRTPRWSPDGTRIACVRNRDGRDDLVLLDPETGRCSQLTYDRWDNTDLDWSPDGTRIAYSSQRCDDDLFGSSICVIAAAGGEPAVLTPVDGVNDRSPRWSPAGDAIAFVSNRTGRDTIWAIAPDGDGARALTEGDSDGDPRWSPNGEWILHTAFVDCDVHVLAVRVDGAGTREVATGGVNEAPRWSPDGSRILFLRSGPARPPDLWVKAWDGAERRVTDVAGGRLQGISFAEPQVVRYTSRDGLTIQALLYRPPHPEARDGPGLVYVRGGPNAVNTNGWVPQIQYLAQRGFTILVPNYRGSLGYGRDFMESNRFVSPGDDIGDWSAAADVLANLPGVDRERIGIMGRSYGGYATLMMLGCEPQRFKVGVAIAAPSDWSTCWEDAPMPWMRRLQSWLMGRPTSHPDLYAARAPYAYAEQMVAPVLIVQGEVDDAVPAAQATAMADRLRELGKECECRVYPGEGHVFNGPDAIVDSTLLIEAFLVERLRGAA